MTTAQTPPDGRAKGRKRGPYANGIERRRQILDTAVAVFGEQGYAGGSLRDIAERVGVTAPAIIRLFGSKEQLLAATLVWSETGSRIEDRGVDFLQAWGDLPRSNLDNRGLVEMLLTVATEASNPEHPAHEAMVERYNGAVGQLVDELRFAVEHGQIDEMDDAQIEAEARGFVALMDGLEIQWLLDPTVDLVGLHEHHFRLMLSRLGVTRRITKS